MTSFVAGCSDNSTRKESNPAISTNAGDKNTAAGTEETSNYNPEEIIRALNMVWKDLTASVKPASSSLTAVRSITKYFIWA